MSLYRIGNSGIGFETSLQLARCHARVYIGGRSNKRLQEAIASMRSSAAPGQALDLHPLQFDLADLQSVKAAAELFQQKESKLHLLINNAGVRYHTDIIVHLTDPSRSWPSHTSLP